MIFLSSSDIFLVSSFFSLGEENPHLLVIYIPYHPYRLGTKPSIFNPCFVYFQHLEKPLVLGEANFSINHGGRGQRRLLHSSPPPNLVNLDLILKTVPSATSHNSSTNPPHLRRGCLQQLQQQQPPSFPLLRGLLPQAQVQELPPPRGLREALAAGPQPREHAVERPRRVRLRPPRAPGGGGDRLRDGLAVPLRRRKFLPFPPSSSG